MTTPNDIMALATTYGAEQYQQGKIDGAVALQPTVDQLNATIAQMQAEDAAEDAELKAQISQLQAKVDALQPVTYNEVSDFTANSGTTGFAQPKGLTTGKRPDQVVYRMRPHTSTVADPATGTNKYRLMRVGGTSSSGTVDKMDVSGFTMQGTDQLPTMKAYGGMQVQYSTNAHLHDMVFTGFPGYAPGPPGETFYMELWHAENALVEDVVFDGRVDGKGTVGVAGTLSARSNVNSLTTYRRVTCRYANAGFGHAAFESKSELWEDSVFDHNRIHLNIERTYGGDYTYRRCTFLSGGAYVAKVSTDPAYGSAKVRFEDCKVDGDGVLRVRVYQPFDKNSQLDSDITCWQTIGGVLTNVTNDPTKFQFVRG